MYVLVRIRDSIAACRCNAFAIRAGIRIRKEAKPCKIDARLSTERVFDRMHYVTSNRRGLLLGNVWLRTALERTKIKRNILRGVVRLIALPALNSNI